MEPKEISDWQHEEFYRYVAQAYDKPRYTLHYRADAPLNIRSIFYVPESVRMVWQLVGGVNLISAVTCLFLVRIKKVCVNRSRACLTWAGRWVPVWLCTAGRFWSRPKPLTSCPSGCAFFEVCFVLIVFTCCIFFILYFLMHDSEGGKNNYLFVAHFTKNNNLIVCICAQVWWTARTSPWTWVESCCRRAPSSGTAGVLHCWVCSICHFLFFLVSFC